MENKGRPKRDRSSDEAEDSTTRLAKRARTEVCAAEAPNLEFQPAKTGEKLRCLFHRIGANMPFGTLFIGTSLVLRQYLLGGSNRACFAAVVCDIVDALGSKSPDSVTDSLSPIFARNTSIRNAVFYVGGKKHVQNRVRCRLRMR